MIKSVADKEGRRRTELEMKRPTLRPNGGITKY
jgi:hypothetical protein